MRGLLLGLVLALGGSAWAAPRAERAAVERLLALRHGLADRAWFERAAREPAAVLRAIAIDPLAHPVHRRAALAALRYWPQPATLETYARVLNDAKTPLAVRHRVVLLAGQLFGARATPLLAPALRASDPQLRRSAARALWTLPGAQVDRLLARARQVEPRPGLRAVLTRMIARRRWAGGRLR